MINLKSGSGKICIVLVWFLSLNLSYGQQLVINEIMASNGSSEADEEGDFEDWIEIKNIGVSPVDLTGYGLSDNDDSPFKWVFPGGTIEPDGFVFVWASGKDKEGVSPYNKEVINFGSEWKYYDEIASPPDNWMRVDFDDTAWLTGNGLFGYGRDYLNYGTEIDFGGDPANKTIGYYFRRNFSLDNISETTIVRIKLKVDDGAIIYLNGNELRRYNLPEGAIDHTTGAVDVVDQIEEIDIYAQALLLNEGINTIAVSVHQQNRHSSDLAFDIEIVETESVFHTNYSISAAGEEILITSPTGELIDRFAPIPIPTDIAYGRNIDQTGELVFFNIPTPGRSNSSPGYIGITPAPVFSIKSGFFNNDQELSITTQSENDKIFYTVDGSVPDQSRLAGYEFAFKNTFPQQPFSQPGEFLFDTLYTHVYNEPITIVDRSSMPNKVSQKSSTWDQTPTYLPDQPVSKSTVIRAQAVRPGYLPSETVTESYFVYPEGRERYSLPVFSFAIDENLLFDFHDGLFTAGVDFENWRSANRGTVLSGGGFPANWLRRDEHPLTMQFFDNDSEIPSITQKLGFRIHGGWSRARRIKSLRLYARNTYESPGELDYPFLMKNVDLRGNVLTSYKRLLIRAGGNDNSFLQDALKHRIMAPAQLDIQTVQPAVQFINGEYWGLINIRERIDRFFIASRYDIDPDNIIMLNAPWGQGHVSMVEEGVEDDILLFRAYYNYLAENDVRQQEHYDYVKSSIDIIGYIDYNLMFIYLNNSDWAGTKHFRYWRVRDTGGRPAEDGRWRFIIWDFDVPGLPENDMLMEFLDPNGNGVAWETNFILRKLLENQEFKSLFANRLADHMNTTFKPDRINGLLDTLIDELDPEIDEHFTRWGHPAYNPGDRDYFNDFAERRPDIMRDQMREHLDVGEDVQVNLSVSNTDRGYIRINTIDITSETPGITGDVYPWSGIYFKNIDIKLEAIPYEGYTFSHWEGIEDSGSNPLTVSTSDLNQVVTAVFILEEEAISDIIHYYHFNILKNDRIIEMVISDSSTVLGSHIIYEGGGLGYMDDVNDGSELYTLDNTIPGKGLRVRNPSANRQLIFKLPTIGYRNLIFRYAAKRTNNGAQRQFASYRLSENENWEFLTDTLFVTEDWKGYQLDLSDIQGAENNPDFEIMLGFN